VIHADYQDQTSVAVEVNDGTSPVISYFVTMLIQRQLAYLRQQHLENAAVAADMTVLVLG
jgi:hypothetical protein